MEKTSTTTWFALRNPVFCRLWLASVLSGTLVSAQDMTATWLMHDLGASPFSLSLLASAASMPFFLFTLPAGAIADIVNRRTVIVSALLWQGACSALLALGAWTNAVSINAVLACIFALGIGLAFGAPVWGAGPFLALDSMNQTFYRGAAMSYFLLRVPQFLRVPQLLPLPADSAT